MFLVHALHSELTNPALFILFISAAAFLHDVLRCDFCAFHTMTFQYLAISPAILCTFLEWRTNDPRTHFSEFSREAHIFI